MTAAAILSLVCSKPCRKCGSVKALTEFHVKPYRGVPKPAARCKECVRQADRDRARANPDKVREQNARQYAKNAEKGRAYSANYRSEHKDQVKAALAKWYAENKERVQAYKVIYNAENKKKIAASRALYYSKNKENISIASRSRYVKNYDSIKIWRRQYYAKTAHSQRESSRVYREKNPEAVALGLKKYYAENPEKFRVYKNNRRARILNAGGMVSTGIAARLLVLQKGKCACCGRSLNKGYHLDHVMPLALGGENSDENIQLLTPRCNHQKHAKHPVDYMQSKGFLL